jgi:hypothetical protein
VKYDENENCRPCSPHEKKRNAYRILVGKPEGWRPLGILQVLEKYDGVLWTGFICLMIGTCGLLL